MKYLVSGKATLCFEDGRAITLDPGIHEYPNEVAEHWAFPFYAQALDGPVEQQEQDDKKGRAGNGKKQSSADS
ncbi:STY1053 family phage-associated protein [Photorhabdus temperata]|uniref:Uncharacterized protein n=1 Tax=Photorhabdus temperata subsp. temperata Meg1 TaxID=1393735 RepID=A0A081RVX0_PHOTE|nr:hypothetical protein [Photorhabdus temperata]KER02823.1 hypothetical protein MEG1DRAFT_02552 [Photorhabdus temperata subsp. temperata Meg1]